MIATVLAPHHTGALPHSFVVEEPQSIILRHGTLSDLETILHIGLTAMPMDPQWNYRFPHRRAFPQDQRDATRRRYREFLEDERRYSVWIAEALGAGGLVPVAFAVWDISNLTGGASRAPKAPTLSTTQSVRRDAEPKRMRAWKQILQEAKAQYFLSEYGSRQIQLQILATHPKYQRLGAGSRLVNEGIRFAEASSKAISVFASPMGRRLYSKLGFKTITSITVQAGDETEYVSVEAMVYEPENRIHEQVKNEQTRDRGRSGAPIWLSGTEAVRAPSHAAFPEWQSAML